MSHSKVDGNVQDARSTSGAPAPMRSTRTFRASDALLFACWAGTIAGLAEAAIGYVRSELRHFPTGEARPEEGFWMAPAAAVAALLTVTLLLVLLDRVARARGAVHRLAPPVSVGLIVYSLVRALHLGIADYALAVLAVGCGALVARATPGQVAGLGRLMRRTTPWMLAGLAAWGAAVPLWRFARERQALAKLPEAARGAPNVLILIWDTARALNLSLYGYERETTPNLERLASRGMVFDRAFATAPWTLPSHVSMLTGRYPHEMSAGRRRPLDPSHGSLAQAFARHGYSTGAFTGNLFYGASNYGLDRGFTWYDDRPATNAMVIAQKYWLTNASALWVRERQFNRQPLQRRLASDVSASLFRWIGRQGGRPFFAFVNHFDAHQPYLPPAPFDQAFSKTRGQHWIDDLPRTYPPDVLRELTDAYDGSLQYLDHELGRLLAKLDEMGVRDNTMVIVTADHGEEFGEHGPELVGHQKSLYSHVLLVPLVIVFPGRVRPGIRRSEPVSIRDLPATVVDAVGLKDDATFPGSSLLTFATGGVSPDATAPRLSEVEKHGMAARGRSWPASAGDMFSLASQNYHYIVDGKGAEQLYDLTDDVRETRNLAHLPEMAERLQFFRASLDSLVPKTKGTRYARKRAGRPGKTDEPE